MRRHGHHHAEADHPVAENGLHEHRDHTGESMRGVTVGLRLRDADDFRRDAGRRFGAHAGERDVEQDAINDAPDEIADEDPGEIVKTCGSERCLSTPASVTTAKLPVTSSSPSNTIITKPTGNTRAPTSGTVCPAAVSARLVAKPSSAPERNPRIKRSLTDNTLVLAFPEANMFLTTSIGLM